MQLESARVRDAALALFDLGVEELLDAAAVHAHQVVVVLAFIEFEHRLAGLEMGAAQDAGLLDIKAIFGETAVRRKMRLKLIVHLVRKETMDREFERLPYEPLNEDILDVPVRKTVIAVDAGRNLAVLVEAAVRNTILQLRGIDTYKEFVERHHKAMQKPEEG